MVNHYKSLSLMAGDDFDNTLTKGPKEIVNKAKDEFDDISSIYTTKQNDLEKTLRRVRKREQALSLMEDQEDLQYLNKELQ